MIRLKKRFVGFVAILIALTLLAVACGGDDSEPEAGGETETAANQNDTEGSTTEADDEDTETEGEDTDSPKGTIAVSHPYTDNPIRIAVIEAARAHAEELGYEFVTDQSQGQVEQQLAAVDAWIRQDVDAMVILPLEAAAFEEKAQEAIDAGIKWLSYNSPMENQQGEIAQDNTQGGRVLGEEAARWINEQLGGEAEVGIHTFEALEVANQRTDAMAEAINEMSPNAEIVAQQDAATTEDGLSVTETFLQANPNLNVVLGINDDAALGAYQAFLNAGHEPDDENVFIGGMDSPERALELVKECGMYRATAALDLVALGETVIDAAIESIESEDPVNVTVEYELLTCEDQDRIDELLAAYE